MTNEAKPLISPEVGRWIEVIDEAQRISQNKYGTSIDGLRQQREPTQDFSKIKEIIGEAKKVVDNRNNPQSLNR